MGVCELLLAIRTFAHDLNNWPETTKQETPKHAPKHAPKKKP